MDPYQPPDELDFDNPFAPPKASFAPETVQHQYAAIPFGIDTIVSAAWSIFKANLGPCLWIVWSVLLLNMGIGFVLGMVQGGVQTLRRAPTVHRASWSRSL